jgi:putative hemolysin
MSSIVAESAVLLVLFLLNGALAMSEMAVVSARRARLERRAEEGSRGARVALQLAEEPTEFLAAIQVGITLVGILSGAFAGATLAEELERALLAIPGIAPYAEAIAVTAVVLGVTYLSLIIGELVPKRIALNDPERIAARVARPMRVLARAGAPVVRLLGASTNLVLRLLRVRARAEPRVTEEEIRALVEEAAETGDVQPAEQELVESVFRLGDRQAGTIMTPRHEMHWLDLEDPPEQLREQLVSEPHSRWVVCRDGLDHVVGVMRGEALLARLLAAGAAPPDAVAAEVARVAREPLYVPETIPAFQLLEAFRGSGEQEALVLDEFGGVQGVVTLTDMLESLVGTLPRRGDEEPAIAPRPGGGWLVDGGLPVDELEARLDVEPLPVEERRGFRTLAGFILARLGRVPRVGERVEWAGYRFEVVDMDGRRIDKVMVTRVNAE